MVAHILDFVRQYMIEHSDEGLLKDKLNKDYTK